MPEGVGLINGWRTTAAVAATIGTATNNSTRAITLLSTATGGAASGCVFFGVSATGTVSAAAAIVGGFGTAAGSLFISGASSTVLATASAGEGVGTHFTGCFPLYWNAVVSLTNGHSATQSVSITYGAVGANL